MFVGKIPWIAGSCKLSTYDSFVGAAIGALGRHTKVTPEGSPVFDSRMEVFFKVVLETPTINFQNGADMIIRLPTFRN